MLYNSLIGTINEAGQTPLSLASASGHLDVVRYLAEFHHCDPRRKLIVNF